jgi:hypothetical protein
MAADASYTNYQDVYAPAINYTIRNSNNKNSTAPNSSSKLNSKNNTAAKGNPFTSRSSIDLTTFSQHLSGIKANTSSQKCARSIRIALQSAGADIKNHPVAAADWGDTLISLGYRKISPQFSNPKSGDIYIINRTAKHTYGHIAGFSGSQWVSDFKQRTYDVYKGEKVSYEYYRLAK